MNLTEFTPKKLRTLRNNLNNRLESFKTSGDGAKPLQKSHMLFGKSEGECRDLLDSVYQEMRRRNKMGAAEDMNEDDEGDEE